MKKESNSSDKSIRCNRKSVNLFVCRFEINKTKNGLDDVYSLTTKLNMKYKGTTAAADAQSTHAQGTNKNISFKSIRVGRGCLLSPTHSTSEDKARVFYAIKIIYVIVKTFL